MTTTLPSNADLLAERGYVRIPGAISPLVLEAARRRAQQHEGDIQLGPSGIAYGYALDISEYIDVASGAARLLRQMGAKPTITQMVLVPKKAGESRRNWHTDTYPAINGLTPEKPSNVMVLCYLEDTDDRNGCLLVLPLEDGREAKGNAPMDGEVQVHSRLGDVIIVNPRLNHAALGNQTDRMRLMIRLRFNCEWNGGTCTDSTTKN